MDIKFISLGELVKQRRKEQGLSQEELAQAAGVGRPYLSRIETSKVLPSDNVLTKIATALNDGSGIYIEKAKREVIFVKGHRGRQIFELNSLDYLSRSAGIAFKYRGFSGVHFVMDYSANLENLLKRGGTVTMILAEPILRNLCVRTLEPLQNKDLKSELSIDDLQERVHTEFHKLMLALTYLKRIGRISHGLTGTFEILLDPNYEPRTRWVVVDGSFCVLRPSYEARDNFYTFQLSTVSDPDFAKIAGEFKQVEQRSKRLNWEGLTESCLDYTKKFLEEFSESKIRQEIKALSQTASMNRED